MRKSRRGEGSISIWKFIKTFLLTYLLLGVGHQQKNSTIWAPGALALPAEPLPSGPQSLPATVVSPQLQSDNTENNISKGTCGFTFSEDGGERLFAYTKQENYSAAIKWLLAIRRKDASRLNSDYYQLLSFYYLLNEERETARQVLRYALKKIKNNIDKAFIKVDLACLHMNGRVYSKEALQYYNEAVELYPKIPAYFYFRDISYGYGASLMYVELFHNRFEFPEVEGRMQKVLKLLQVVRDDEEELETYLRRGNMIFSWKNSVLRQKYIVLIHSARNHLVDTFSTLASVDAVNFASVYLTIFLFLATSSFLLLVLTQSIYEGVCNIFSRRQMDNNINPKMPPHRVNPRYGKTRVPYKPTIKTLPLVGSEQNSNELPKKISNNVQSDTKVSLETQSCDTSKKAARGKKNLPKHVSARDNILEKLLEKNAERRRKHQEEQAKKPKSNPIQAIETGNNREKKENKINKKGKETRVKPLALKFSVLQNTGDKEQGQKKQEKQETQMKMDMEAKEKDLSILENGFPMFNLPGNTALQAQDQTSQDSKKKKYPSADFLNPSLGL